MAAGKKAKTAAAAAKGGRVDEEEEVQYCFEEEEDLDVEMSASMLCNSNTSTDGGGGGMMTTMMSSGSSSSSKCSRNSKGMMGMMMRKGPWTEQEDVQLVWFVRLFGERRWDFLAKVSGLKRTGKSCRLRWVNYLHPGLKRGRITPEEEKLILQLHGQWGSRWSRIARSLPGRTDNEIKNFWRTHTRKMAHHHAPDSASPAAKKTKTAATAATTTSSSSSSSSELTTTSCSGSTTNKGTTTTTTNSAVTTDLHGEDEAVDQEATTTAAPAARQQQQQQQLQDYTMDQLWNEIAAADAASYTESWGAAPAPAMMAASPVWEPCADYTLWKIDDEEYYKKMLHAS